MKKILTLFFALTLVTSVMFAATADVDVGEKFSVEKVAVENSDVVLTLNVITLEADSSLEDNYKQNYLATQVKNAQVTEILNPADNPEPDIGRVLPTAKGETELYEPDSDILYRCRHVVSNAESSTIQRYKQLE